MTPSHIKSKINMYFKHNSAYSLILFLTHLSNLPVMKLEKQFICASLSIRPASLYLPTLLLLQLLLEPALQ